MAMATERQKRALCQLWGLSGKRRGGQEVAGRAEGDWELQFRIIDSLFRFLSETAQALLCALFPCFAKVCERAEWESEGRR